MQWLCFARAKVRLLPGENMWTWPARPAPRAIRGQPGPANRIAASIAPAWSPGVLLVQRCPDERDATQFAGSELDEVARAVGQAELVGGTPVLVGVVVILPVVFPPAHRADLVPAALDEREVAAARAGMRAGPHWSKHVADLLAPVLGPWRSGQSEPTAVAGAELGEIARTSARLNRPLTVPRTRASS